VTSVQPRRSRSRRPAVEGKRELRQAILDASESLLAEHRFDEITVAQILTAAGVSRASFYFYFAGKSAVLAELVRNAVDAAQVTAQPWLEPTGKGSPADRLREGTTAGVALWHDKAPVLRAIVENWRTDDELAQVWTELMDGFTTAAVERIGSDPEVARGITGRSDADLRSLAGALTWLNERIFYLSAIGVAPFDDDHQVVDVLTEVWVSVIYGRADGRA
jgi:AcrR family transcriptional regulator